MSDQNRSEAPFGGARRAAGYVEALPTEATTSPPIETGPPELIGALPPSAPTTDEPGEPDQFELTPSREELLGDLGRLSTPDAPAYAARGVRGALGRLGIRMAPRGAELAALERAAALRSDETTVRQATWTDAVSILVANRKGGVGKTPVSVCLGGVLAAIRGGSVAVIEVSDDPGTLTFRSEGSPQLGIGELVRDADRINSAGQLAGYTAPQTSFASIIGTVGPRQQLTGDDVARAARVVDSYYAIRVMDSGNQPSSSAFEGAAEHADVLVVPVLNSADVVLEAVAMLEQMRAAGGHPKRLADAAIVVRLTDGRVEHPKLLERLGRIIDNAGIAQVHSVPYDPHIAERGEITIGKLAPATRAAFTAVAAGVVRALRSRPTTTTEGTD